jgi:acyl-CoA reductase-like NAD-dependent aldehyde dehydrogenase
VFSGDTTRAEKLGLALKTGMMNINDFAVNYLCQSLPFGGVKVNYFLFNSFKRCRLNGPVR